LSAGSSEASRPGPPDSRPRPLQPPRQLDQAEVQRLQAAAEKNPADEKTRVELGNLYFDAERYPEAIAWYQQALKINPNDADVSTDLGVCYYYANDPDRSLRQFEASLKADPKHVKTLLNQGIVMAYGKQDLKGAVAAWEKLIQIAPTSPEAETAGKALQGLKTAHPELAGK
jgi:tetratricopeptide (TPR) repeat protein